MSGQSKFMTSLVAAFGALLMSSVAVTAAVGPVQVPGAKSDARIYA